MKSEKVKRLNCRVSEDEYKRFEKKVEKSKLTKSEFMRKVILEKEIIVIDDIKELQEMKIELDYVWREVLQALKKVNG
ncbi:MAG: ribbon-helix-helix protein, CopG family [Bacilli bacterium]|uniref:plasmid mobilization protein n=1 Tax=uncultured Clostridium sp. TaxID=59620 RepID=UPI0026092694|nr:ribbon-helix-helix protein, CopG family [uncultured Clostridium sp.]MCI9110472.1 ribbon-helix-helix protein, CopG family [Bacilli bacterium]